MTRLPTIRARSRSWRASRPCLCLAVSSQSHCVCSAGLAGELEASRRDAPGSIRPACPAERPPLSAMAAEHAASARRARRARAAHGPSLPQSRRTDRAARSVRLRARDRMAGGQGRVPVRQRGMLVGAAAPLRALRHDRDRGADRAAQGARAGRLPCWSAIRACRPRRSCSTP